MVVNLRKGLAPPEGITTLTVPEYVVLGRAFVILTAVFPSPPALNPIPTVYVLSGRFPVVKVYVTDLSTLQGF